MAAAVEDGPKPIHQDKKYKCGNCAHEVVVPPQEEGAMELSCKHQFLKGASNKCMKCGFQQRPTQPMSYRRCPNCDNVGDLAEVRDGDDDGDAPVIKIGL